MDESVYIARGAVACGPRLDRDVGGLYGLPHRTFAWAERQYDAVCNAVGNIALLARLRALERQNHLGVGRRITR